MASRLILLCALSALSFAACASGDSAAPPALLMLAENETQTCVLTSEGLVYCSWNPWGSREALPDNVVVSEIVLPAVALWRVPDVSQVDEICVGASIACARTGHQAQCWRGAERIRFGVDEGSDYLLGRDPLGFWISCAKDSSCIGHDARVLACGGN